MACRKATPEDAEEITKLLNLWKADLGEKLCGNRERWEVEEIREFILNREGYGKVVWEDAGRIWLYATVQLEGKEIAWVSYFAWHPEAPEVALRQGIGDVCVWIARMAEAHGFKQAGGVMRPEFTKLLDGLREADPSLTVEQVGDVVIPKLTLANVRAVR